MKTIKLSLISMIGLFAGACSEDKFKDVSNGELTKKQAHCDSIKKKSPGFAVSCENIRKEVERRRDEKK